jgi:hypothetical protein
MGDYCKLFSRIWHNEDFAGRNGLDGDSQLLFLLLMSFDTRNNAGVLPLTIKRWARARSDGSVEAVTTALQVLIDRRFVVVDWETEEALIRTFIRNDEVYLQPNLMANALKDCQKVESRLLRSVLQDELLRISTLMPVEKPAQKKIHEDTLVVAKSLVKTPSEGLREPFTKPFMEPLPEGLGKPPGVGGYVSPVGNSPTPTPAPSPTPSPKPPPPSSGVEGGELDVLDAELVPVPVEQKAKATYLPDDWQPSQRVRDELKAKYPNLKLGSILEEFVNYWTSLPKVAKNRRIDWDKTFRNRVSEVSLQPRFQRASGVRPGVDTKATEWESLKEKYE